MFVFTRLTTCLTLLLFVTFLANAQQPGKTSQPPPNNQFPDFTVERSEVDEKDIPKSNEISFVQRLSLSPEPDNVIRSDADRAIVEKVLKYYIYRLTWEEVQKERDPKATISLIMTDLIGHAETNPRLLPRPFPSGQPDQDMLNMRTRQLSNVQQMTPIFIKVCREVLRNKQPIARINAARILAKLAEWGQEPVVDELVNIINHPKESDAVKIYAFHGLEDIFNLQWTPTDQRARGIFQSKEGQARLLKGLTATYNWLDANTKVPEVKLQYMRSEELAAIRYVRRAASQVLGAGRRPLIVDERQTNKQEGPIADLLSRIVGADASIVPAPDLRERLDASIALAQLRTDFTPSYNPDFAAFQIGSFLTVLGSQANADKANNENTVGWNSSAHKLRIALDGFTTQKTTGATTSYLASFNNRVRPLLEFFDDFNKNTDSVKNLSDWLRANPPASKQIYKLPGEK